MWAGYLNQPIPAGGRKRLRDKAAAEGKEMVKGDYQQVEWKKGGEQTLVGLVLFMFSIIGINWSLLVLKDKLHCDSF